MAKQNIVCIGGGTGTHTLLTGLKAYTDQYHLSAIVTMADSGGSTGRLRDEFGQLPVGDIRMALAALADQTGPHQELLRKLFLYRFDRGGGLAGHNFGNLFLTALTDMLGSESAAITAAVEVLRVQGAVYPVTDTATDLIATYSDNVQVTGEHHIDEPSSDRLPHHITQLAVTPTVTIAADADAALRQADVIILGPGDLYTSIIANLAVPGVAAAIAAAAAPVVFICNLMTKAGQTTNYTVGRHIAEIGTYLHTPPDYVLVNNAPIPAQLQAAYAREQEFIVSLDTTDARVIARPLIDPTPIPTTTGDTLKRSLVRHDPHQLAACVVELLQQHP